MNRQIKFRGWDTKKKNFIDYIPVKEYMIDSDEWNHHDLDDIYGFSPGYVFEHYAFKDRIIFQQFTGLKDRNNKEIYEGDICEISWTGPKGLMGSNYPRQKVKQICKVIFKEGIFTYEPYCSLHNIFSCTNKNSEIIGNIFENPQIKLTFSEVIGDCTKEEEEIFRKEVEIFYRNNNKK